MKTDDQKQSVILNIRSTAATYIMYWHKLCIEITVFLATCMIGIGTFTLTRIDTAMNAKLGIAVFLLLLATFGFFVIRRMALLLQTLREVLVKTDQADKLFSDGEYVPNTSIYPKEWESNDAVGMDFIPKASMIFLALLSVVVSFFILLT